MFEQVLLPRRKWNYFWKLNWIELSSINSQNHFETISQKTQQY
jgi:hypothetical protein